MKISGVRSNKKQYLPLLLLADEQEDMIDRYLDRGTMYVLDDDGIKSECVVTDEGNGVLEIKNLATLPEFQCKGYAKALIDFLIEKYAGQYETLQVGTGDSPATVPFMRNADSYALISCQISLQITTIIDGGVLLKDMVYLQREM